MVQGEFVMRLLFSYLAEKIYADEQGSLYVSGNFSPEVWERYLSLTDDLHVLMTLKPEILDSNNLKSQFHKIDTTRVTIHPVPINTDSIKNFFSPSIRRQRNRIIENVIEKSDAVIIRTIEGVLVRYCKKYDKKYAAEVVGCAFDSFWNHSLKGKVLAVPSYLSAKRLIKNTKYVLYVTEEYLQKKYPTNGVSTNCSNVSLSRVDDCIIEERVARINMPLDKLIIGTAAALNVKYKGQQYVIRALHTLKKRGIVNIEYQLVGGGDPSYLLKVAEKYGVSDQVKVIGRLNHDDVFRWLRGIDLYIQPSLTEGLPRALIEAMSYGVPVVGSNVGGIPELLPGEMLFEKRKHKTIASLLERLTSESMSNYAKQNFLTAQKYNGDVLNTRRFQFYSKFIEDCKNN